MLCGSQMRPILCLMILTSYLMVRGSIRGAKETPFLLPSLLPPPEPQLVEAGKSIPGRIIWRAREKEKRKKVQEKKRSGYGAVKEPNHSGDASISLFLSLSLSFLPLVLSLMSLSLFLLVPCKINPRLRG